MTFDSPLHIFVACFGIFNSIVTAVREIPQVIKIFRHKSGKDVSTWSQSAGIIYSTFWIAFGFVTVPHEWAVIVTSIIIIATNIIILVAKYAFKKGEAGANEKLVLQKELMDLKIKLAVAKNKNAIENITR